MSYGKIYNLGHPTIAELLLDEVVVQEKIDGSQFSFGVRDGRLWCRSKSADIDLKNPGMFSHGVNQALAIQDRLIPDVSYYGEYLQKPKHNTLNYARVPIGNVILFDVHENETRLDLSNAAGALGMEHVPELGRYAEGSFTKEVANKLLGTPSILGNCLIEGMVIKNFHRFGPDGKPLMGKYVSEAFKETHKKDWKDRNPGQNGILSKIVDRYTSPTRWAKAVQHLRDQGKLTSTPADIGPLLVEIKEDTFSECGEEISKELLAWARGSISKGITRGFPEWYKAKLAEEQFEHQP